MNPSKFGFNLTFRKTLYCRNSRNPIRFGTHNFFDTQKHASDYFSSSSSSNSDSDITNSSGSEDDDEPRWDDTICSNRSSYFKLYYGLHRGVGEKTEGKGSASRYSTTQNSLTSLIREKMGQNQPPPAAPQRTKADIGLMVLVVFLFIIIVVGISLIYYFYHQHLLELKIFNRLKFTEDGRILHIYNDEWKPQTTALLGTTLDSHMLPEDCTHYLHYMHEHNKTIKSPKPEGGGTYEDFVCLDWTYQARLQLRKLYDFEDVHCYLVWWVGNHDRLTLRDCVLMGEEDGTWWGGGEMTGGGYPLNKANIPPTPMMTGELGRHPWGKLLRRAWMSSTASLLTLPNYSHAKVSINHNNNGKICMESFPDPMAKDPTPTLEYTLCRASNMTSLFRYLHKEAKEKVRKLTKNKAEVLNEHRIVTESDDDDNETKSALGENNNLINQNVLERVVSRMEHPVWIPWLSADQPDLTQQTVLNYVKNIVDNDYGMWGHVLLPSTWQAKPGTLEFDKRRFSDPKNMSETLESSGFKLALTIHPFVSVNIPAFDSGTEEGYWLKQKDSVLPALTQYVNRYPAAVTDFTNPRATHWYLSNLKKLQGSYKVERFHLQQPNSFNFPTFHDYHEPLSGPDASLAYFVKAVSEISAPVSIDGTIGTPPAPTFLTVGEFGEGWRGLETLVARVLTLTSTGSPFVDVGVIGGLTKPGHIPDRELYIRWIQTASFMPAFQINTLPHVYDRDVENLAKEFTKKRQELVLPRLREDLPNALKQGTPLAKPLIYHFPDDEESAQISDQWMLGNDLLVAPVIQKGVRVRDIYLPPGIWKDLLDGRMRRGGRYIKEYKVPLTQLPHF
ncbi:unnamed protein product, partial [Meganyctiphanes norvegica]